MNKKVIGILIVVLILFALIGAGVIMLNNKDLKKEDTKVNESNNDNTNLDNDKKSDRKVLVVYYSASNNTKNVALKIANNLNSSLFQIEPVNKYTTEDLDWTDENSRVYREYKNESLRDTPLINTKVENWDSYDTILIGYPIWWGVSAWPINNFVKDNDFTNKKVIPFCTSASSGIGESDKLLESLTKSGTWLKGHRFSSTASDKEIKEFTDSI